MMELLKPLETPFLATGHRGGVVVVRGRVLLLVLDLRQVLQRPEVHPESHERRW